MLILQRYIRNFSMDFSNLSNNITTTGLYNYKIEASSPIQGYFTKGGDIKSKNTVIMIHQWWGFNTSMVKTAQIMANDKIQVFVPDLYRAKPAIDAEEAGHKMNNLNWTKAIEDIKSIKEHFDGISKSVSIMGFCMGGALAFASVANIQGWKCGSPFYGIPDLTQVKLDKITCKVLAHFGKLDPLQGFSDAKSAEKLSTAAKEHNYPIVVKYDMSQYRIWQNAGHAFCNQDSKYFNKQVRDEAFKMTCALIEQQ